MNHFIMEQVADGAICKDKVLSYLDTVRCNVHLSAMNQALLHFQKPGAGLACGRTAWKAMGRTVKEDAVPIIIYLPEVRMEDGAYRADYKPVNVFDVDSTEGESLRDLDKPDIIGRILELTGGTTEVIEREMLRNPLEHGMYDGKRNVFYLERGLDKQGQEAVMLSLLVGDVFADRGIDDRLLELAVRYVLMGRYGLDSGISEPLFMGLDSYGREKRMRFIIGISGMVLEVVRIIEGDCLSFDETAFVNCLMDTGDKGEMVCRCMKAAENAEDELLSDALRRLGERMMYEDEGRVRELFRLRQERRLMSFPAVRW